MTFFELADSGRGSTKKVVAATAPAGSQRATRARAAARPAPAAADFERF
jgi:hypothetical protein